MKRYIPIVASLMVFSLISCDEVMDLTQPEKAEVTYSNITLSLYQTGKYDLYLDEPEYQYNIMVEKSHCEKEAKAKLAVVDAKEFGEEYHLLPVEYYDLDGSNFNFNVSSTNSKQSKLCVKCTLYIDTRLFGKHAVRRNRPQYVYDEIVKASVS